MVIDIDPHARDDFNDLATLTIRHGNGRVQTPGRAVNRYDLNAKTGVGADVSLMQDSGVFMLQEVINPAKLNSIMGENGFLDKMRAGGLRILDRIGDKNLKLFYPSFTAECLDVIRDYSPKQQEVLVRFLCNTAIELNLESVVLQDICDINDLCAHVSKFDLQLIPSINMKIPTHEFEKRMQNCNEIGSRDIPMIALQFAGYPAANKAYDYVMERFDDIHEGCQGVIMVNAPRAIYAKTYRSVSAPHYGAFFAADLSVERYGGAGGVPNRTVRLFSRDNLSAPKTSEMSLDVDAEKTVFGNDPKLQELFVRVARNTTTEDDWKGGRPKYVARVHECIRTHPEFRALHDNIESNSARTYLGEKDDMDVIVNRDLDRRDNA